MYNCKALISPFLRDGNSGILLFTIQYKICLLKPQKLRQVDIILPLHQTILDVSGIKCQLQVKFYIAG